MRKMIVWIVIAFVLCTLTAGRRVGLGVVTGLILLGAWAALHLPRVYERRWLAGIPCTAPCWEGVTPGRTTVQEAVQIWNADPGIAPGLAVREVENAHNSPTGSVIWNRAGGARGGWAHYTTGLVIDAIHPEFGASFTLQEVMARYGTPTHIVTTVGYGEEGQGPFYDLEVLYNNYGIRLGPAGGFRDKPEISPQTAFDKVSFYALPYEPSAVEKPWLGFRSFDDYCTDDEYNNGPCPGVPYSREVVLGIDGLVGAALVCGWRSQHGQGPLPKPMGDHTWLALLGLSLVCGLGTLYMLQFGWL